ncbi:MAG: bifunctional adenosylcobinamide kinase/adenosylcobinamide-phosphate guanylyltransferase [Leucothrix sp.]
MTISLVLGGARSGKSNYAENLAKHSKQPVVYVATAQVHDEATAQRISAHQQSRPAQWKTVECPLQLGAVLEQYATAGNTVLVDCLTMWVTNLLCEEDAESQLVDAQQDFFNALKNIRGDVIFVSNEVGMGIIPMGALTRDYVDIAGRLHQDIAAQADRVELIVAGLPLVLKDNT